MQKKRVELDMKIRRMRMWVAYIQESKMAKFLTHLYTVAQTSATKCRWRRPRTWRGNSDSTLRLG